MSMFSDVREFHLAFGQRIAEVPGLPDKNERSFRRKLLAEEVNEYIAAEAANDLVEVSDALADIAYIICGTAVSYGLGPKGDYTPLFAVNDNSKAEFPELERRKARLNEIKVRFAAYEKAEDADDLSAISVALQDLMDNVFACGHIYSIPLVDIFKEVHRSNMAKLVDGKVLRRPDGKVQKPAGWTPPNIKAILFPEQV